MNLSKEYIYYDALVSNSTTNDIVATYDITRTQPLLRKCSDYKLSIVKFSIPANGLPLMILKPLIGGAPNQLIYSVTLSRAGVDYQTYLIFVPENDNTAPSSNYAIDATNYSYYQIYHYNEWCLLVNTALQTSFNALVAGGGITATGAPYITYDPVNSLYTLVAPVALISTDAVSVYMNNPLRSIFESFQGKTFSGATNGKDYLLNIYNRYNNVITIPANAPATGTSGYSMVQDFSGIANISGVRNIVFTSVMPIRAENFGTEVQLPILAEFTYDGLNKASSQFLLYNPTAEFRMIDMTTDVNLTRVQFNIYWRDNGGQLFPLYLPPNTSASVKFMWRSIV